MNSIVNTYWKNLFACNIVHLQISKNRFAGYPDGKSHHSSRVLPNIVVNLYHVECAFR